MKNLIFYIVFLVAGSTVIAAEYGEFNEIKGYEVNSGEFNCSKYGPDSIKAIQYYSLYREYFKQENYAEAMKYWPYVYENAPALNVRVISNGMEYYEMLIESTEPGPKYDQYVDSLMMLYDHRIACHGDEIKWLARKGLDIQKYDKENVDAIRSTYNTVIEEGGDNAPYYVLKPYFQILLNDLDDEQVSPEYVLDLKDRINAIIEANMDDAKYGAKYQKVMDDIDAIFSKNRKVQELFNCDVMKPTWEEIYRENPNDLAFVKSTYNKMRNGCEEDVFTTELFEKLIELEPTANRMMWKASQEIKADDYDGAIEFIKEAINLEGDVEKISEYNYKIAEMYYAMKDFSTSRSWARKASKDRPDWGKPYLLIGKLYASSGKLCGPGTGLESQRVIWPALDYFNKAKSVDASSAEEAQRLINKYWQYLPEKSEIFMAWGKGNGEAYFVDCWIQENTTIRTK
jgi:tetratricopeptide (TPR) repeat protein